MVKEFNWVFTGLREKGMPLAMVPHLMSTAPMPRFMIAFASPETLAYPVAGVPAVARAVQAASVTQICLALPDGRLDDPALLAEIRRLAPGSVISMVNTATMKAEPGDQWLAGEQLVISQSAGMTACAQDLRESGEISRFYASQERLDLLKRLDKAGWSFIAATGKPGDGIVSRHINRPISTRISRLLLRWPAIRPVHATALAALFGLLMTVSLFSGKPEGLIAGAVLFQIASVIDGVDGEIARATHRTSAQGAMMDTVTDGFTNVAFLAGLGFNLHQQGSDFALLAGLSGTVCFAIGLILLGLRAAYRGETITFDAVKYFLNQKPSWFSRFLIYIAMRDFFALASMVMIVMGLATVLLAFFAGAAIAWLFVVIYVVLSSNLKQV